MLFEGVGVLFEGVGVLFEGVGVLFEDVRVLFEGVGVLFEGVRVWGSSSVGSIGVCRQWGCERVIPQLGDWGRCGSGLCGVVQ